MSTFECQYCKEEAELESEIYDKEIDTAYYTFSEEEMGGYDGWTRLPICQYCAEEVREEIENNTRA